MYDIQYAFCLSSTSWPRISSSFTLFTSTCDGPFRCRVSMVANTARDSDSMFSGDELKYVVIEYSGRGIFVLEDMIPGEYVPLIFSRSVSMILMRTTSTSAWRSNRFCSVKSIGPVKEMYVIDFGSVPLRTTFSTTPVGGLMPTSFHVSFRPVLGKVARYCSANGLSATVSTFPTNTKVKSLASAKR